MLELFLEFLRFGALSIGGGFALLSEIKRILVVERAWLPAHVFVDGWSLGQFVPGPNMLCMAFYGFQIHGIFGAMLAWLGMFAPGIISSIAAAKAWQQIKDALWAKTFRATLLPIGFGFGAGGVYTLAKVSLSSLLAVVLVLVLAALLQSKRFNPMTVVFLGGLIGIITHFWL